jgi:anti-sigma factor RsiW
MNNPDNSNFDDDIRLGEHIRAHATRYQAKPELRDWIRTQVTLLKVATQASPIEARSTGRYVFSWHSATVGLISGVVLTLALSLILGSQIQTFMVRPSLESALVSRHVYSMGQGQLFEVMSSDRHTVKPWFQGKLDFSPPVPDLASVGFPLRGGRVDHIDGKAVAALAYMRRKHVVNAFIWPSEKVRSPQPSTRKGFNLLHWDDGKMQIWLVSDLNATELNQFGQAWREQISGNTTGIEGGQKQSSAEFERLPADRFNTKETYE